MYDRMQTLTDEQLNKLHSASMEILQGIGVAFHDEEALEIFQKNGFTVDGKTVHITEKDVRRALETVPERFTVAARNSDKSVDIGQDRFALVPAYGAPFVTMANGDERKATMEDYDNFCKLVQTSKVINMNGFMMVEPSDVPVETAHLDMIYSSIVLSDKPFMGSPVSKEGVRDGIEMVGMIWGGAEKLKEKTATVSLINSLSPLQYSKEMAGSLIVLARYNQACVVASLMMAGSSGPVTLAGVLAVQNAEILAGIVLSQLVRPGAPVIYGSTSAPMDMKTGGLAIGAPELSMIVSATAQMARFYHLPSRSGGGLTDSHIPDAQAAAESALALVTAVRGGINFILHAGGILGSYISASFEKFIIDEEICAMINKLIQPIEITDDSIDLDMIRKVGIGGQYLTQPKTFKLCRKEFFLPSLMNRKAYIGWSDDGKNQLVDVAVQKVRERLTAYEKPDIDPGLEKELSEFVGKRKKGR